MYFEILLPLTGMLWKIIPPLNMEKNMERLNTTLPIFGKVICFNGLFWSKSFKNLARILLPSAFTGLPKLTKNSQIIYYSNGILLPKLFWSTVRKNCPSDQEKLLKFEAEGREFANIFRLLEEFIRSVKGQTNFCKRMLVPGGFSDQIY